MCGEEELLSQAFLGTAARPLGRPLARRPCPDRSRWHGELSHQPTTVGSHCSAVSQGNWSLWSQLHGRHVVWRVPDCSISSKSRCSDDAATYRQARAPHLPTEAGRLCLCWLLTSCRPCRPLCCTPVSSLNSQSPFYPLAHVLWAVSTGRPELRLSSACQQVPFDSRAPCWRVDAEQAGSPRGLQAPLPSPRPELQVLPAEHTPPWPRSLPYNPSPCPAGVTIKVHRRALAAMFPPASMPR